LNKKRSRDTFILTLIKNKFSYCSFICVSDVQVTSMHMLNNYPKANTICYLQKVNSNWEDPEVVVPLSYDEDIESTSMTHSCV